MMPNIVRGGDAGGLLVYLFGEGRKNEHKDQHIVASSVIMDELGWSVGHQMWGGSEEARACGADLEGAVRTHNRWIMRWAKRYDPETGSMVRQPFKEQAHVWHCSLTLHPDEPALTDKQWEDIVREFMDDLGFNPDDTNAECRWVAVRHGENDGGGDHVHIAASVVREDGTLWKDSNDFSRAQNTCMKLEEKHGLVVVSSRQKNIGARGESPVEQAQARKDFEKEHGKKFDTHTEGEEDFSISDWEKRGGKSYTVNRPITVRGQVEALMRAALAASSSEKEFVEELGALGVYARPRFDENGAVSGFAVGYMNDEGEVSWFSASRVARDLSLPRLRRNVFTVDNEDTRAQAREVWGRADSEEYVRSLCERRVREQEEADMGQMAVNNFAREVENAGNAIGAARTPEELAQACQITAGYFAVMSVYCRSGGWQMANAARMLARVGAQTKHASVASSGRLYAPRVPFVRPMLRQGLPVHAHVPSSSLVVLAQALTTLLELSAERRETNRYLNECRHAIVHLHDISSDAQSLSQGIDPSYSRTYSPYHETGLDKEMRQWQDEHARPARYAHSEENNRDSYPSVTSYVYEQKKGKTL